MKTEDILREERVWATWQEGGPRVCVGGWVCGMGLAPSLITETDGPRVTHLRVYCLQATLGAAFS